MTPGEPSSTAAHSSSHRDHLAPDVVPADTGLRERYEAYRRRQGAELLSLVPGEGVRAIYRAALEAGHDELAPDALGRLADFCADLLPLPPFEVWRADFELHRAAHLDEAGERAPYARSRRTTQAVTVELRSFEDEAGLGWYAGLDVRRADGAWRGRISFHRGGGSRQYRTADVFREEDADAVRTRFANFDEVTLRAFLRSVLP